MTAHTETAIVVKRADAGPVETDEIEGLVAAAGLEVVEVITQVRAADPGTYLGAGKVDELVDAARRTGATVVVVDGELTGGQVRNLAIALPDHVTLLDRYRLILDIFADQASDRRATLQVDLERARHELEWVDAVVEEDPLTRMQEKGSPRYQLEDRITTLERELRSLPDPAERHRDRRREEGFDLVTVAGYTNAGKSTLLRRLADDLSLEDGAHADETTTAAVEDRLFKTLETTTRRATLRGRRVLVTDTVGYIDDLPHDVVVTFAESLSAADAADLVLLVTEATDTAEAFDRKLTVSMDVLAAQGVDDARVIPVLNKMDAVGAEVLTERMARLGGLGHEPIAISALEGTNLEDLVDTVVERLPTATRTITVPYTDGAMALVSEAYDRVVVTDVAYDDHVTVDVEGRPAVVEELSRRAERLDSAPR